jgi:hypothetical protein
MAVNMDLAAGPWQGGFPNAKWTHVLQAAQKSAITLAWCRSHGLSEETGLPPGPAAGPPVGPEICHVLMDPARLTPRALAIARANFPNNVVPWRGEFSVQLTGTSLDLEVEELELALKSMSPPVLLSCPPRKCASRQSGVFLLTLADELAMLSLCMNLHGKVGHWPRRAQGVFMRVRLNVLNELENLDLSDLAMGADSASGWEVYIAWAQAMQKNIARHWPINQYSFAPQMWPGHGGYIGRSQPWPPRDAVAGPAGPAVHAPPPGPGVRAGPPAATFEPVPGPGAPLRGEAFLQQRAAQHAAQAMAYGAPPPFKAPPPGGVMPPPVLAPGKAPPPPPGTGPAVPQQAPAGPAEPAAATMPAPTATAGWAEGWQGWNWQPGWAQGWNWQPGWQQEWNWQHQQSWETGPAPFPAEQPGPVPAEPVPAEQPGPVPADPFEQFPLNSLVTVVSGRPGFAGTQGTVIGYSYGQYHLEVAGREPMAVKGESLALVVVDLPAGPGPAAAGTVTAKPRFKQPPRSLTESAAAETVPKSAPAEAAVPGPRWCRPGASHAADPVPGPGSAAASGGAAGSETGPGSASGSVAGLWLSDET